MESWWPSPDYEYRFQYTHEQTHVKAFFQLLRKKMAVAVVDDHLPSNQFSKSPFIPFLVQ